MKKKTNNFLCTLIFLAITSFPSPCFAKLQDVYMEQFGTFTRSVRQFFQHPQEHEAKLPFEEIVAAEAKRHGLDPCLIHAIIRHESNYQTDVVSKSGAQGLMQLMPRTAKELGIGNSFNPRENIAGGTKYYRQLFNEFGDHDTTLLAYNSGPGNVRRGKRYQQSKHYAKKVIATWNRLYRQTYLNQ